MQERTAELRAAQNELVHAGKLAVLGQMSAGMVHELNQPLAALRTLSDNAALLLDRERLDEVRGNLQRIVQLVDRLGRLTSQLKVFAHKCERAGRAGVRAQGDRTKRVALVAARLRDSGIDVSVAGRAAKPGRRRRRGPAGAGARQPARQCDRCAGRRRRAPHRHPRGRAAAACA